MGIPGHTETIFNHEQGYDRDIVCLRKKFVTAFIRRHVPVPAEPILEKNIRLVVGTVNEIAGKEALDELCALARSLNPKFNATAEAVERSIESAARQTHYVGLNYVARDTLQAARRRWF